MEVSSISLKHIKDNKQSSYHNEMRRQLRAIFGNAVTIKEEYEISDGVHNLRLDYFVPAYSLGIEVDGEHHFEVVDYGKNDNNAFARYEDRYKLDNIKGSIMESKGWPLVRIKYTDVNNTEKIKHLITEAIN